MSIKIKARITKELFHRDDYYILAATPTESNRDIKLNQYGGFTLVGNLPYLTVDHEYELEITEGKATKYGINYEVCSVPSLSKKEASGILLSFSVLPTCIIFSYVFKSTTFWKGSSDDVFAIYNKLLFIGL